LSAGSVEAYCQALAEATGELALGSIDLAVQIIPLHVADDLAVHVQLVQVTAAVIQVIDLAAKSAW